jgi:hypothetical protein
MSVPGSLVIDALIDRLSSIKIANGYPLNVKQVEINRSQITMNIEKAKLPMIEVIDGEEEYQHEMSGHVQIRQIILVRFILPENSSDKEMEVFKSCIVRCMYANAFNSAHNSGVGLVLSGKKTINFPRLLQCSKDVNLVDANRIWELIFELNRSAQTWEF